LGEGAGLEFKMRRRGMKWNHNILLLTGFSSPEPVEVYFGIQKMQAFTFKTQ
jgi:hypothetical protein